MQKILPIILATILSGCFGPATLDTTNQATIKSTIEKMSSSLPSKEKDELSKAITYYSLDGSNGVANIFKNAINKKETSESVFVENLQVLHGKTSDEIMTLYKRKLTKDQAKKAERAKVLALIKEAEKLLSSNKFQEAINKYKDISLLESGVEEAEKGIDKANSKMKEFTEKTNYISKIKVTEFISTRIDTYTKKNMAAVRMGFKNTGDRSLDKIKVTVFFQDKEGKNIHEEDYTPVLVSKYGRGKPLKPGYSYEMEENTYKTTKSPLSEWEKGKATIKSIDIEFSDELKHTSTSQHRVEWLCLK